jgi:hypothetical protein
LSNFPNLVNLQKLVILNDIEELALAEFGYEDELGAGLEGV